VQKVLFPTISQIGIEYRHSPMSQTLTGVGEDAPHAGDRFPWVHLRFQAGGPREDLFERLDDRRFNLLLFGQEAPAASQLPVGDRLMVHAVPTDPDNEQELARASIPTPSFYLLRPDGHVGLAGTHVDENAVTDWLAHNHLRLERAVAGQPVHPIGEAVRGEPAIF
jgi:hypothetical protein